jgi:hypothetical protein
MDGETPTVAIWLPISQQDHDRLESLLKKSDVLTFGNYRIGPSNLLFEHIRAAEVDGVEFKALFDQNLISPLVNLAKGQPVSGSPENISAMRLAAACIAFCILAGILIEPAMAIYEYASTHGHDAANTDLLSFRIADNSDPLAYLDIALGKTDRLPKHDLHELACESGVIMEHHEESNFARALRLWKPHYLYVLKIIDLSRSGLSRFDTAVSLLRWQEQASFYNAAASMYCLAAIAHQPPKGDMLKGLMSENIQKLKSGIRNATWDIYVLQQFGKYMKAPSGASWSLWSADIGLRAVARRTYITNDDDDEKTILAAFLTKYWGTRDGKRLLDTYFDHRSQAMATETTRDAAVQRAFEKIDVDIENLERKLGILAFS